MADSELAPSDRTRLRRKKERGSHERGLIERILDEGFICHVGFAEDGSTVVLPTAYARVGDTVYLHGAAGNRMLRALATGIDACVTVTLLDGLVLARSAFHHSMNYRSVVLFGRGRAVEDVDDKRAAVLAIVEHMAPGRSADARLPTDTELRSTLVVAFPIEEGSAKVRRGGPIDDPEDLDLPVWAGHVPFVTSLGAPEPDAEPGREVALPAYITDLLESRRPT
ncbi:MAG TPA: pyridoxamine 5'-phosphate oxidase family protein [Acidimicrobiales bacterium]|nr:pyridoxamine 5'-phosphate oxidase family protein [Acidimicrobiales bacterium]